MNVMTIFLQHLGITLLLLVASLTVIYTTSGPWPWVAVWVQLGLSILNVGVQIFRTIRAY
jgi:hypothetical protein